MENRKFLDNGDYNFNNYNHLSDIVDTLTLKSFSKLGYKQVCSYPPIWVLDSDLKELGIPDTNLDNCKFETIENPGAYVPQKKTPLNISKNSALNNHLRMLTQNTTFIDNNSKSLYLKVYSKKTTNDEDYCLDRLHIDRNRDEKQFRKPMKFTMIICHNDCGSIYFPFALYTDTKVDKVEHYPTFIDSKSANEYNNGWNIINKAPNQGIKIASKPGRIIIFVSSDNNNIPLYRSLHQGMDDINNNKPRMISVIGWDNKEYETSGFHECIEHESFEMRASFFNRTIEEELVGVAQQ